jgi:zinc ribbon protein
MAAEPLVCPSCASTHPSSERFCPNCGMPLVHAARVDVDAPVSPARERARKIRPQYTEGELVRVAGARHQAEAELVQGLLLEEGIPSMLRRSRGFDVPDMLAAGPRDVMVPASGAQAARDVLLAADLLSAEADAGRAVERPARLLAGLLLAVAVVGLIAWLGTELIA